MSQTETSPKEIVNSEINRLKEKGVFAGFPTGKPIPNFDAVNQDGNKINIFQSLEKDDLLVINFFRGNWCGYCRQELEDLRDNYNEILARNGKVISIGPQSQETLKEYYDKLDLPFDVLADPHLKIANLFNLVWHVPEKMQKVYAEDYDLNVPELNANDSWDLPVPATYIINRNGDVLAKFEDLDYRNRMPVDEILSVLEKNN